MLLSFSSHCYPEKALAGWLQRNDSARVKFVAALLEGAGFVDVLVQVWGCRGRVWGGPSPLCVSCWQKLQALNTCLCR